MKILFLQILVNQPLVIQPLVIIERRIIHALVKPVKELVVHQPDKHVLVIFQFLGRDFLLREQTWKIVIFTQLFVEFLKLNLKIVPQRLINQESRKLDVVAIPATFLVSIPLVLPHIEEVEKWLD